MYNLYLAIAIAGGAAGNIVYKGDRGLYETMALCDYDSILRNLLLQLCQGAGAHQSEFCLRSVVRSRNRSLYADFRLCF